MTHPTLPMPGDPLGPDTVVASCWQVDELGHDAEAAGSDGCYLATLLVLHPEPAYYGVVTVACDLGSDDWQRDDEATYPNIIPAAEAYAEAIGGY